MRYTVIIRTEGATSTVTESVHGVAECDVQAVKDAARFAATTGDYVSFQVITD